MGRLAGFALLMALAMPALTGCDDTPPSFSLPTDEAHAVFRRGGLAYVVAVDAANPRALRKAELVAPDGAATEADYLQATRSPTYGEDQRRGNDMSRGNAYGISTLGGGIGTPPLPLSLGASAVTQATLMTTLSTAEIAVPDEVAYRREWRDFRVRLTFGNPEGPFETRLLPAPAPLSE